MIFSLSLQAQLGERDSLIVLVDQDSFGNDSVKGAVLQRIATLSNDPEEIIYYSTQLINEGNQQQKVVGYFNLGYSSRLKGELNIALDYLDTAASISIEHNNYSIGSIYQEMATCFSSSGDFVNSLKYNKLALKSKPGDATKGNIFINLAYDYYDLGQFDSALHYYDQADTIFLVGDADFERAYIIGNRALVKWKLGQTESAISDLKKAITMLEPLGDNYGMADYYNQLGTIYYELGDLDNAADNLTVGIRMAIDEGLKEQIRDASKILSNIYSRRNQPEMAYRYLYHYISMRDSIANEEVIQQLANQRADYEISLKQAEVDLANQQKRNRQILAIAMGAVALLAASLLVNFYVAYQKRKRLSQKLQALNATKDKFFSIVSHDLRGPISAFAGISSIIKGFLKKKSYDDLEEMTHHIDKSAQSLSALLDNLLTWAVQQQGQIPNNPTVLDVNQLVEQTFEIFESAAAAKEISLTNRIEKPVFIFADKDTMMTVFRNLLGNALKFTETGGKVWVEAETTDGMVHIHIRDTGVGMAEEQIAHLFQMKEKRSYGTAGESGLGVGLQLVNEFVTMNHGDLLVESKKDEGSTFTISFPKHSIPEGEKEDLQLSK